jgi:hypothetical protein
MDLLYHIRKHIFRCCEERRKTRYHFLAGMIGILHATGVVWFHAGTCSRYTLMQTLALHGEFPDALVVDSVVAHSANQADFLTNSPAFEDLTISLCKYMCTLPSEAKPVVWSPNLTDVRADEREQGRRGNMTFRSVLVPQLKRRAHVALPVWPLKYTP